MAWARRQERGVVGSFAYLDDFLTALKGVKPEGVAVRDVFTPVPVPEAADLVEKPASPVPLFTFAGGLAGMLGGFALGIGSALVWNIVVGGKPVPNHVPFVVIAFEGLILLGAIATFLGILLAGRLPFTRFPGPAHQPEFSNDRFGLWLDCPDHRQEAARSWLREAGAFDVHPVGGEGGA